MHIVRQWRLTMVRDHEGIRPVNRLQLILLVLTATLVRFNASATSADAPNVLVIVSDDQRPDTIAELGNRRIKTPTLDQLVRQGVAFTRATCGFPLCVPSRSEILTGATAMRTGIGFGRRTIDPELTLWGNAMRSGGYRTWYCGKWMNDGSPKTRGYDETAGLFSSGGAGAAGKTPRHGRFGRLITGYRGWTFKTNDGQPELQKGIGLTGETSRHIADGAIELLSRDLDRPFFLHVNFTAPHDPLILPPGYENKYVSHEMEVPPDFLPRHPFDHGNFEGRDEKLLPWPRTEEAIRQELAAYYAVIDDMDAQIGRILRALDRSGRRENTVIVFTSDHGLALGSHGLMGKQNMYEHTIGVPFIIAGPGIPQGVRSDAQIYLRDMFPTVCELAGIETPATVQGKSLVPILNGETHEIYPAVYGYFYDFQRMVRTDRWKLIRYPKVDRTQLFDLKNDPFERNNLADQPEHAATVRSLSNQLESWFAEQR